MKKYISIIFLFLFSCVPKQEDVSKSQWQYFYDLGMSSYIAKNYSEAIANFFKASQLAPDEPKVWNALGLAYMEVQEYQKAENAFLRGVQVNKTYTEAKLNLGILYYRQKDYEKALKTLREVIEDDAFPQKHLAFYSLAKVYQAMDRREEYLTNLRRAVAYNPMFVDAQLELAQFYEEEKDYRSAKDTYQRLINNGIVNSSIYLSMARVEYHLGNYPSAKDYIRRIIEDKQTTLQLKAQAYEILSLVLIAEEKKRNIPSTHTPQLIAPPISPEYKSGAQPKPQETEPLQQRVITEDKPNIQPRPQDTEPYQPVGMFYRIQLGAFSSVSSARSWKEKLERELNLKDVVIVESSGIFRVFYGKFEKREDALRELNRLRAINLYGFIVQE